MGRKGKRSEGKGSEGKRKVRKEFVYLDTSEFLYHDDSLMSRFLSPIITFGHSVLIRLSVNYQITFFYD